jgi:hypothetical protein
MQNQTNQTNQANLEVGDRVFHYLDPRAEGRILAIVEKDWAVVRWDRQVYQQPDVNTLDYLRPVPKVTPIALEPTDAVRGAYPTIVQGDVVAPRTSGKADLNRATYRVLSVYATWAWCVPTNGPGPITFAIPDLQIIRRAAP